MIPLAAIVASFEEGASVREAAERHRLALPLARALWEALVADCDPAMVGACTRCGGRGLYNDEPC